MTIAIKDRPCLLEKSGSWVGVGYLSEPAQECTMLHRVRKCKYTSLQPVQISAEVDGERYNVVTGGPSW